jgi:hypothetical protein
VIGLGVLATTFRPFATLLDRTEVDLRHLWLRLWKSGSITGRALIILVAIAIAVGTVILTRQFFIR